MPPRYLLDSNIIIDFQNWGHLDDLIVAAGRAPMAIVQQVYTEVAVAAAGDSPVVIGKKRKANSTLENSALKVVDFVPGTSADRLYRALAKAKRHDRGEAASIAFARHDGPDCIFVNRDRNATLLALNELSDGTERVMRPFQFVRRICDSGALESNVVHSMEKYVTNWGLVPSWCKRSRLYGERVRGTSDGAVVPFNAAVRAATRKSRTFRPC